MMTINVDDGTLLAYIDGALEHEADYARVEQALAQDERVHARLQTWVEQTQALRRAYQDKLTEPLPPHLVAAILNAPLPAADALPKPSVWQRWWLRNKRRGQGSSAVASAPQGSAGPGSSGALAGVQLGGSGGTAAGHRLWQGLAATGWVALGVLALGWWSSGGSLTSPQAPAQAAPHWAQVGATLQDDRLLAALKLASSAQVLRIGQDTLEVMASFERAPGQHCREVQEVRTLAAAHEAVQVQTLAVLCQAPDGTWKVSFAASETVTADQFVSASDAQIAALEGFYSELGPVALLTPAQERERLAAGWSAR